MTLQTKIRTFYERTKSRWQAVTHARTDGRTSRKRNAAAAHGMDDGGIKTTLAYINWQRIIPVILFPKRLEYIRLELRIYTTAPHCTNECAMVGCSARPSYESLLVLHHHHHIYSPQNTISTSIQESRGRLPERHKHPSMLAALTTSQVHKCTKNILKNSQYTSQQQFMCMYLWSRSSQ